MTWDTRRSSLVNVIHEMHGGLLSAQNLLFLDLYQQTRPPHIRNVWVTFEGSNTIAALESFFPEESPTRLPKKQARSVLEGPPG